MHGIFLAKLDNNVNPVLARGATQLLVGRQNNDMNASVDYIYWAFSAAAQSISAFVALLLAGYALVQTLMDSARERDDTLEEVHTALRKTYHKRLKILAWLAGAAIVLSLLISYCNRPGMPVVWWAQLLVGVIDLAAIGGGLYFVVSIVDPDKYQRAAAKVLEKAVEPTAPVSPSSEFFEAFLHLERLIREYLRDRDLYVPSKGAPRMSFSFRQMIEALRASEKIDGSFFEELLEINKYRNLVFHGHVTQVDTGMVKRTRDASSRVAKFT
jgi:hypothetical protein